jgi:hypothetical protein
LPPAVVVVLIQASMPKVSGPAICCVVDANPALDPSKVDDGRVSLSIAPALPLVTPLLTVRSAAPAQS